MASTRPAGDSTTRRKQWWPAVVAAGFGGGVVGAVLAVEASGELADEGYDGLSDRPTDSL